MIRHVIHTEVWSENVLYTFFAKNWREMFNTNTDIKQLVVRMNV